MEHLRPILVFDSGAGGLPYLAAIRDLMPLARFVYVADRAGFPYGRKPREDVEALVRDRMDRAIARFDPAIVVIACNTASQAALDAVRRDHPERPIVGTVPAVKPAAERTRSGVIAVLATNRAASDPYLTDLIERFATGTKVVRIGAQDLVEFVEHRLFTATVAERSAACRAALADAVNAGADEIVLACTHFLHVADDIAREAGDGVRIVDSRDGVARRVAELFSGMDKGPPSGGAVEAPSGHDGFWVTGAPPFEASYRMFAERYGLAFMGSIDR